MSQKKQNVVEEYLVKRIKELEKENERLIAHVNNLLVVKQEAWKYEELVKLFKVEGCGGVLAICQYDLDGRFAHIVSTESNSDFPKYIELLGLEKQLEELRKEEE